MQHWTVHEKVEVPKFPADMGGSIPQLLQLLILNSELKLKNFPMLDGGVYSTPFATFDPELRNERFTLISFIGFPAILSTLQPFEICIFNRT